MLTNQPFIKKASGYLLNKYVLTAIITLIIVYFLPDVFTKFKITPISSGNHINSKVYFQDLNSDGTSEKIVYYHNSLGNACYMIFEHDGSLIDQYNFSIEIADYKRRRIWFHDVDKNGVSEIYSFTKSQDSIFLNIHEPLNENGIDKRRIFVDSLMSFHDKEDVILSSNTFIDVDNNGETSFIFLLNSGRSGTPRNVYKYHFNNGQIIKSKHLTNNATITEVIDLDGDNNNEILLNTYASGNSINTLYSSNSDYSSWFTVMNNDLDNVFLPIEFKSKFSSINVASFLYEDKPHILVLEREKNGTNNFIEYTIKGKEIKKVQVPSGNSSLIKDKNSNSYYLQLIKKGTLIKYNSNLEKLSTHSIPIRADVFIVNLMGGFDSELVAVSRKTNMLKIFSPDFKFETTFNVELQSEERGQAGLYLIDHEKYFYISKAGHYFILKYAPNPLYFYQFLIYFGVFMGVLMLLSLAVKGQKIQEAKKRRIEEQIADLQLKSIKNQVDPHFVFNAVNTISEMTLMENKLEADQFICEFSELMRKTLNRSDKIATTIKDEVEYVTNYLRLQQIRLNNAFSYNMTLDENIKDTQLIPKHTIYTFVENAIKYGIHNKLQEPQININVSQVKKQLVIIVTDNGGGLKDQKDSNISTGNGIRIMASIFSLYDKRFKTRIEHSLSNYLDANGQVIGVKAEVKIKLSKSD